jgi:shikimate kinase
MNLVLIGFMGSGKSSVAHKLSTLFSLSLVEMDELVYQKSGTRNMHEVFANRGELFLREMEIAIAKEYAPKKNLVISTGAGVVLNKIILDYFKQQGAKVIFLRASFEQIVTRLEKDHSRPLFQHLPTAKTIYDFRLPLYLNYADLTIEVDFMSIEEVTWQIKEMIKGTANGL